MALTNQQRSRVVYYLGWSGLTIVDGSTHYNSVVDDRLTSGGDNDEIARIIKELLEKLENIDKCLEDAKCRLAASQVDNITMNEDEIRLLNKERRRYVRELSDHLDIPIMKSGGVNVGLSI